MTNDVDALATALYAATDDMLSTSKLSRMEVGRNLPGPADLGKLLDLYGVADAARRDELAVLLREAKRKGWWQVYSDIPYSTYIAGGRGRLDAGL